MRFVPLKSAEQLDLQALHRARSRLVTQRTAVINQIRGFLLERGLPVRQGAAALRLVLPRLLSMLTDDLSPRIVRLIHDLAEDWRYLDWRVACITKEIDELADQDAHCRRLMSAPGVGPIISSAMVAAIGTGDAFAKGRDFAAWLGLVAKQISTGDRTILGRISRRGNRYLRTLNSGSQIRTFEAPKLAQARLRSLARSSVQAAPLECTGRCPGCETRTHGLEHARKGS